MRLIPGNVQLIKHIIAISSLLLCTSTTTNAQVSASARADLAPTGTLRAAINFGNPILATRSAASGEPEGVSVDISRELARRLGVPIELVTYESAGRVVADISSGNWDVAFVAIDPARAVVIDFTPAYVTIEGAYLVREISPIRKNAEVDQAGVTVAVGSGSAYDLFLSRTLKEAGIVRAPTSPAVVDMFLADNLDVAAGVRQQLEADARRIPGLRLLDGSFMAINQAMATPRGRDAGAEYLHEFIEDMKASGFVSQALQRHAIAGASVAPPAPLE